MGYKIEGNKLILESTEMALEWCNWNFSEDFEHIEEIEGENRRWSATNEIILKHTETGKLFSLEYEKGLTECQPNECNISKFDEVVQEEIMIEKTIYKIKGEK